MSDDPTGPAGPYEPPQPPPPFPYAADQTAYVPPPVPPPPAPGGPPLTVKTGADAWPWYYSLAAFLSGFLAAQMLIVVLFVFWEAGGGDADNDTWFLVLASAINSVVFVGAAVTIARLSGPVHARDFGLVRAPYWITVAKSFAVMVGYFILLATYNQLVNLTPDDAPEQLGADSGTLGMLGFAILVSVIAPIAEEIFYRGMVYRALSNGVGAVLAAIISGLLFGSVHIDSFASERLLQVVPLALLGILFALLYAWTGTLYAPIALHATNNALAVFAFANEQDSTFGMVLAGVLWILMIGVCTFGYKVTDRRRRPPNPQSQFLARPERPPDL